MKGYSAQLKLLSCLIAITLVGIVAEGASYIVGRKLAGSGLFYIPRFAPDYERYLQERDPKLGWPAPSRFGVGDFDSSGSRMIPSFPDPAQPSCVSLYGDSFTWGDEVDSKEAWSNKLSVLMGCRVANYGVGGYGTDQALLRLLENEGVQSGEVVVLAHLSENILRNVNQLRDLLYPGDGRGFKPRYVIEGSASLRHVPLPTFTAKQYREVMKTPSSYLPHEFFRPGGDAGVQMLAFPYTLRMLLALRHYHLQAKIAGVPRYLEFYDPAHSSGALELTYQILKEFRLKVEEKGGIPLILILPTSQDLEYRRSHDRWPYQSLLIRLNEGGLPFLSVGEDFLASLGESEVCSLFASCGGHYNGAGNQVVAEAVHRILRDKEISH